MKTFAILISACCIISFSSCATRVVSQPNSVTIVKTRPANYKMVTVHGKRYYFWNGNHYRKTRRGYVIVVP
jgi:YHS domain-containing protein